MVSSEHNCIFMYYGQSSIFKHIYVSLSSICIHYKTDKHMNLCCVYSPSYSWNENVSSFNKTSLNSFNLQIRPQPYSNICTEDVVISITISVHKRCSFRCVICFACLCLVFSMLPFSLDFPFLIVSSIFFYSTFISYSCCFSFHLW